MTIMFVTTVLPADRRTGGEVASSSFIDAMRSRGHRVAVVGYRRPGSTGALEPDATAVASRPIESRAAGLRTGAWLAAAIARGLPYSVAKYRSRRYRRVLRELAADLRPDLVVIDHAQMGWVLPLEGVDAPLALLAHNVEHEVYGLADGGGRPVVGWLNRREARLMTAFERRTVGAVDRVWTLTDSDAASLTRLGAGSARSFPVPSTIEAAADPAEPRWDVGILGTWTWGANAVGLRWFAEEVRPLLPGSVSVAVAGAGSERFAGPDVTALGRVEDAGAFLRSSRVVAIPSVAGGGLQIKTLDAIAAGATVVATPTALRGIEGPPPTVRAAAEPHEFAATIRDLLRSPPSPADRESAGDWAARRRELFRSTLDDELAAATAR